MPEEHVMKAAMQRYIDSFNAGDAEGLSSLFADDATIEDPVGSELVEGIEAIAEFYRGGVKVVTEMSLSAPIRGSHANAAAMAFDFKMNIDGKEYETGAIDVMEFNAEGKITSMRAYWGPSDTNMPAWES